MARWAGFDTTDFTTDPPRSAATWPKASTCNPQGQNLALYTANHYAGRTPPSKYFGRYFLTPPGISPFNPSAEVAALRTATFFYILPISAPDQARQSTDNVDGKTYGIQDANITINNMVATRPYGVVPGVAGGANVVYVFLDVESRVRMSAWYWEGWSETIYNYSDGTWGSPFWPCVYATPSTVAGSTDKATMDMLVGYISRSDTQHSCQSLWTTQPSYQGTDPTTCGYSTNNPAPPGTPPQDIPRATPDWSLDTGNTRSMGTSGRRRAATSTRRLSRAATRVDRTSTTTSPIPTTR